MAAETIVVNDNAGADVTLTEVLPSTPGTREFRLLTDTAATMRGVVFQYSDRKSPNVGVSRRRVHIFRNVEDSESGVIHRGSITMEIVLPPTEDFGSSTLKSLGTYLCSIILGTTAVANMDTIMAGAVPTGAFGTWTVP